MFDNLKKKLFSFFKKEEPKKKPSKTKEKKVVKVAKPTKASKPEKPAKSKASKVKSKEIIAQERAVTQEIVQDIKKEGLDIKSPEERIEETASEIATQEETSPPTIEGEEETPKEEGFFAKLIKKISSSKLTQEQFDEIFLELELILLENNVALEAVDATRENLAKSLVGKDVKKSQVQNHVMQALKNSILALLIEPPSLLQQIKNKEGPFTILFFGINGTGKTTSIAKLAHLLKKEGISCVLAAADTFRAASIEQLKTHAVALSVPIVAHQYNTDPAAVAFDAKKYALAHHCKVILIDTAGRMYTKENLLKEMEKIVRIAKPDLKFFVGESITGNDVIEQAKTFNDAIGIDGIILSKADIDEKAGTILSVSHVTHKPIYFLGTGQRYDDLTPFTKKAVLKNLGLE